MNQKISRLQVRTHEDYSKT